MEEERPVHVLAQDREVGLDDAAAGERRRGQIREVDAVPVGARLLEREQRLPRLLLVLDAQPLLELAVLLVQRLSPRGVEELGDDADHARGVEHVHRRRAVGRRDPHGGVLLRRRRAADQQRQVEAAALHLARHVDHLVQRRRDQAGEPDDVGAGLRSRVQDPLPRHHDAEVDHLVVVAAEHDADDVLADVVHVPLDRGQDDRAALGRDRPGRHTLRLHERLQVGDGALHRPRALHHLREEHLPRAEEVADDAHPGHERPLDHVQRPLVQLSRLLDVLLDVLDDPVHERMLEPLVDGLLAPARGRSRASSPRRSTRARTRRAARSRRVGG